MWYRISVSGIMKIANYLPNKNNYLAREHYFKQVVQIFGNCAKYIQQIEKYLF